MACNNTPRASREELLQYTPQRWPLGVGIATSIAFLVCTAAFAVLFAQAGRPTWANLKQSFAVVPCSGAFVLLVTTVACGVLHYREKKRAEDSQEMVERAAQLSREAKTQQARRREKISLPNCSNELAIPTNKLIELDKIDRLAMSIDAIHDLLVEAEKLVFSLIAANARVHKKSKQKIRIMKAKLKVIFDTLKVASNELLTTHRVYLKNLLATFGRGRQPLSVALRRLIAAKNSDKEEFIQEAQEKFDAIERGHDLEDVAQALNTNSSEDWLVALPDLLANHFSSPDESLRDMGVEILKEFCELAKNDEVVLANIGKVRKKTSDPEKFVMQVEELIQLIFERHYETFKTQSPGKINKWIADLVDHSLDTTLDIRMRYFLKALALNIDLVSLLFDREMSYDEFYIKVGTTLSNAASCDYLIGEKKEMQEKLFEVQTKLSLELQEPSEQVSLLVVEEGEDPFQTDIAKHCFAAYEKCHKKISSKEIQLHFEKMTEELRQRNDLPEGIELVVLPTPAEMNHPFIIARKIENNRLANAGRAIIFDSWQVGLVSKGAKQYAKPRMMKQMPKLSDSTIDKIEKGFDSAIKLLIPPICNGSMLKKNKFKEPFEHVIKKGGAKASKTLKKMARQPETLDWDPDKPNSMVNQVRQALKVMTNMFNEISS